MHHLVKTDISFHQLWGQKCKSVGVRCLQEHIRASDNNRTHSSLQPAALLILDQTVVWVSLPGQAFKYNQTCFRRHQTEENRGVAFHWMKLTHTHTEVSNHTGSHTLNSFRKSLRDLFSGILVTAFLCIEQSVWQENQTPESSLSVCIPKQPGRGRCDLSLYQRYNISEVSFI